MDFQMTPAKIEKTATECKIELTAAAILATLRANGNAMVRHTKLISIVGHEYYTEALDLIQSRRKTKIIRVRGQNGGVCLA
jgi:chromosomal replication initiation ATPase DnaA